MCTPPTNSMNTSLDGTSPPDGACDLRSNSSRSHDSQQRVSTTSPVVLQNNHPLGVPPHGGKTTSTVGLQNSQSPFVPTQGGKVAMPIAPQTSQIPVVAAQPGKGIPPILLQSSQPPITAALGAKVAMPTPVQSVQSPVGAAQSGKRTPPAVLQSAHPVIAPAQGAVVATLAAVHDGQPPVGASQSGYVPSPVVSQNDKQHIAAPQGGQLAPTEAVRPSELDCEADNLHTLPSGNVGRRAPQNPFNSPVVEKLGLRKRAKHAKVRDPKLLNNPLRGRLVVCISTTALLIWIFLWELLYNYTSYNGRCVSAVEYPPYTITDVSAREPYVIRYGYGGCQNNLNDMANVRGSLGSSASDKGWPTTLVKNGAVGGSTATWDSPNGRIFLVMGGLDTNYIRNYGEVWRVFSSMYLHGGIIHIMINLVCQIQILWMIEPDWGFLRTALLFFIGGVTGNLLSSVADPCSVTVGSSGAMYALVGALIPYCIEYWKTIPRPCCVLVFMIVVLIIGIITGMSGFTDNYAHIGGCVGGILFGFASITTVAACDKCTLAERMATTKPFCWFFPKSTQQRLLDRAQKRKLEAIKRRRLEAQRKRKAGGKRGLAMKAVKMRLQEEGRPPCKMAFREWLVRLTCGIALIILWVVLFLMLLDANLYGTYQPPGQLKFQGWLFCKCGKIIYEARQSRWNRGMHWCFGNSNDADFYLIAGTQ